MIADRLRALRFLSGVTVRKDVRPGAHVRVGGDADVYRPRRGRSWATVVVIHGLTPNGRRDPRVIAACRALARVGVQAVAPEIPDLQALRISAETSDRIAEVLVATTRSGELGRPRRVGVVSASFAAGLTIRACASVDVAHRIAGLLLIGTYVDARALLAHVFGPHADPYGRDILCASLGARTPEEILATRAADVDALSALPALRKLRAPVALLHGAADDVIPPSESVRAAQILERAGIPCQHAITTLIDHGTPGSPWTRPQEVVEVAAVTASWFAALRGRHAARVPVALTSATRATKHQVVSSTTNGQ